MIPNICHIYGPFYLNSYGLCIFIGILVFTLLAQRNWLRKRFISKDDFLGLICWGTLVGIAGGRLLFVITNLHRMHSILDVFAIWEGGLSLLGAVISISLFIPLYLRSKNVPVLPILDLVAVYAPLLIGISRFGCFFAGCCYGRASDAFWAITYTNPDCLAPLNVALHPTQLYSALALILLFFYFRFVLQQFFGKPGMLFGALLLFIGAERALVDLFRGDLEFFTSNITIPQAIGGTLMGLGIMLVVYATSYSKAKSYTYESF